MVLAGLLSDIFDGALARRWNADTPALRLCDSMADTVFYIGCAAALWLRHPQLIRSFAAPLALVLALELSRLLLDLLTFGKPPSYHSWLAKPWGLVLAATIVLSFIGTPGAILNAFWWAALLLGVACGLEGLAMSLLLPLSLRDVSTLASAYRLRASFRQTKPVSKPVPASAAVLLLLALCTFPSFAQNAGQAIYENGTAGLPANTTAAIVAAPDALQFRAAAPLRIPTTTSQT